MHRLIFWGIIILILVVAGLIVDQVFYRIIRLFLVKHTANVVRLITFISVIVIITTSVLVGMFHTRMSLRVNNINVSSPRVPAGFEGFRIAQISDFHIDSFDPKEDMAFVDEIVETVISLKPDIICFTGDLVTQRSVQARPYMNALKKLASANIPVFGVMGNHDYADYVWGFDEVRREQDRDSLRGIMREAGWRVLDNDCEWLHRGCDSILVAGVGNIGEPPFTTYGNLDKALRSAHSGVCAEGRNNCGSGASALTEDDFVVLLSHNPSHWRQEVLPETNIDLMLAGHTHAMQFKVFGWSPSAWKYKEYSGLYNEGDQYLYVNTGLGCTGPKIRIGVKPEITVITLKK